MKKLILYLLLAFSVIGFTPTYGQSASTMLLLFEDDGVIPYQQDALFYLDGTIVTIGESKYFQDKSGNGRNFLITTYDFASDWTVGFPYKSAATISAPAGDTILIQEDVNNFLYAAADSVPNQIPVVSLFQDIGYMNKLFTRHASQDTNSVGVETYESRVLDIVLYDNTKTGGDLTKCQTYYGVPTEVTTNVKWVAKTGNDGNAGTKAEPYLTLKQGDAGSSANYTVYARTGTYIEDHNTSGAGYFAVNKHLTVSGLGFLQIKALSTGQVLVPIGGSRLTLNNAIVGNTPASTYAIYPLSTSVININKSWIKNGGYVFRNESSGALTISNSILSGATNRVINIGTAPVIIQGSYINNGTTTTIIQTGVSAVSLSVKNNRLAGFGVNYAGYPKFTFIGNKAIGGINLNTTAAVQNTNYLYFKYNTSTMNGTGLNIAPDFYDTQVMYNNFLSTTGTNLVQIYDQTGLEFSNNLMVGVLGTSSVWAWFGSDVALDKTISVHNNFIQSKENTPIQVGGETVGVGFNKFTGSVYGNRVYSSPQNVSHGITCFRQNGVSIKYNYVEGYTFAAIVKVFDESLANAPIMYNLSKNNGNGISAKGGQDQYIVNNTIINPTTVGLAVAVNPDSGGHNTTGLIFKNNIIINATEDSIDMIAFENGCSITSDYNIFYSADGDYNFEINGFAKTKEEWLAAGYDAHSIFLTTEQFNALFTDFDGGDYSLATGSLAIDAGEDLGETYDDGLDATTDWGSTTRTPVIVTKQQIGDWDAGAYVK